MGLRNPRKRCLEEAGARLVPSAGLYQPTTLYKLCSYHKEQIPFQGEKKKRIKEPGAEGIYPGASELPELLENVKFTRTEKSYVILGFISTFPKRRKLQIINNFPS